jgi:hypothetical protein
MIFLALMAATAAEPPRRCTLDAWSNDADPAGLRVHAGPGLATPEIGRLPAAIDTEEERYAPNFHIVDVRDGWVKIADADDLDNPGKPRPVFRGTGWVHGSRVVFTVQSETGRAAPSPRAKAIVRGSDWLGDAGERVQPIVDCSGGWARLRYTLPAEMRALAGPRAGIAWFGGICGNQFTTCDGLDETKSRPGRL